MKKRCVVVVGCPGSGMSVAAWILRALGGDSGLTVAPGRIDLDNLWMYDRVECKYLTALIDAMWEGGSPSLTSDFLMGDIFNYMRIRENQCNAPFYFLKETRLASVLRIPALMRAWEMQLVVVERPLEECILSWSKKRERVFYGAETQAPADAALVARLWMYKEMAVRMAEEMGVPYLTLSHGEMVRETHSAVRKLTDWLDLGTDKEAKAVSSVQRFRERARVLPEAGP